MREVVIVEAVRTPLGRGNQKNGDLRDVHPLKLAAHVLREVVGRPGVDPALVEDVVMGCVSQVGEQSINVARQAVLLAGFPIEVPATTVDRQCGSSQQAVHFAANLIQSGVCDVTIAAGVESMSRVPMGSTRAAGPGDAVPARAARALRPRQPGPRRRDDRRAVGHHPRRGRRLRHRVAPPRRRGAVGGPLRPRDRARSSSARTARARWCRRTRASGPATTVDTLAQLQPSFRPDGILHAGNSSQITDGAARRSC